MSFEDAKMIAKVLVPLGAGLCMGIGSLGPALGQGFIGGKVCEALAKRPDASSIIGRNMFVGMAFVESSAIYCLVVSLLIIFLL